MCCLLIDVADCWLLCSHCDFDKERANHARAFLPSHFIGEPSALLNRHSYISKLSSALQWRSGRKAGRIQASLPPGEDTTIKKKWEEM